MVGIHSVTSLQVLFSPRLTYFLFFFSVTGRSIILVIYRLYIYWLYIVIENKVGGIFIRTYE